MNDLEVAIKIFPSHYRQYYYNERDIYSLPFMDSSALLKFYGTIIICLIFNIFTHLDKYIFSR